MAPDTEELIKKINSLTLDKNRLRQKLTQLSQGVPKDNNNSHPLNSNSSSFEENESQKINSNNKNNNNTSTLSSNKLYSHKLNKSLSGDFLADSNNKSITSNATTTYISGIECSSSCEDDLLYVNELYRRRVEEYNDNWDFIQSKCTAILAELKALQEHYSILKKEKLDLEEKYDSKCDELDKIKAELQTVVLNYETQLSAMSEHLSMITSQT